MVKSSKEERRTARERVVEYHDARVADLLTHVAAAMDSYRGGGLNVTETDTAIHQYDRAMQELWKFCFSISDVELVAQTIDALTKPVDWWERGEPCRPKETLPTQPRERTHIGYVRIDLDSKLIVSFCQSDALRRMQAIRFIRPSARADADSIRAD